MRGRSSSRPHSTTARGRVAEQRAAWRYRLRGYRILGRNVRAGGVELDLIVRRGRRLVFVEVKTKTGKSHGDPLDAVDSWKQARVRRGIEAWLAAHPGLDRLAVAIEIAAVRDDRVERVSELLY
jgi:Holliday junction resolvase-like predicted endonuclease